MKITDGPFHKLTLGLGRLCSAGILLIWFVAWAPMTALADSLRPTGADVVWTTPSTNAYGSMPLGNGDLGLNLWAEKNGDLLLLISKTDAWDENDALLKLGRVRIRFSSNPFQAGLPFHQELNSRLGEILIRAGEPDSELQVRIWVDANNPVIHVEADGRQAFGIEASLELWRTALRQLSTEEASGIDQFSKDELPYVYPDVVVQQPENRITWYHRNRKSIWAATLRHQNLEPMMSQFSDPLINRTFGGAMFGDKLVKKDSRTLVSSKPARKLAISICALTAQTATPETWVNELNQRTEAIRAVSPERARAAHRQWWNEFWNRSWVRVTASRNAPSGVLPITHNKLPLRLGADSEGQNGFKGELGRVAVYATALSAEQLEALAATSTCPTNRPPGCVWEGYFSRGPSAEYRNSFESKLTPRSVGDLQLREISEGFGGRQVLLSGHGFFELAHCPELDLTNSISLEAWICPDSQPAGGGRIIDKSKAGTSEGYLLDTCPGNSLRLIVADGTLGCDAKLPTNKWSHVAGVFDSRTGEKKLYLNGKVVASSKPRQAHAPEHEIVTRGYALQRFMNACAGRGGAPIKFNGSIFTVEVPGKFSPDYRLWGGCYWFQNTRLPYWPMLASGDFDLMQPLFRMFGDTLRFARARTELYYKHGGAFFPETMHFWGSYFNGWLGYGWDREGEPVGRTANQYIRYHWSNGLELLAMMLDYYDWTGDSGFLERTLLPHADAVLEFYSKHYPRRADGRLWIKPAQALETFWECEDPLPEVAGLHFTIGRLLALASSGVGQSQRAAWETLRSELPPIPVRQANGSALLSPAAMYSVQRNIENAELYAVFPFRIYGVDQPDLELARRTFEQRLFKGNVGWQQDDTQAAFLGLSDQARRKVVSRFSQKHAESRFPAFWGPNFDWIPDQDHGGNGLMALQTMLLQANGRKLLLLPAWPRQWDVEFKLHAPFKTIVEGVYRDGKLQRLLVTPPERQKDVVQCEAE